MICAKKNAIRPMAGPGGGLAFAGGRRASALSAQASGGARGAKWAPGAEVKIQK